MVREDTGTPIPTFYDSLSEAQKKELEAVGVLVRLNKGEVLFMPGDDSEHAYLIKKGSVKAAFLGLDGKEIALPLLRPGQVLGISSFLDWGQRICYATAINEVEALRITKRDMKAFINHHIDVAMLVIEYLGMRLKNAWKIIEELSSKNVKERLIRLLYTLSNDFGKKDGEIIVIDINLTHEQIAQMIGTSRQTVSTIVSSLENSNAIKKDRKRIVIRDSTIFDELE